MRPPSEPAVQREDEEKDEEGACLSFSPPAVRMTQFSTTHTYTLRGEPIHSHPRRNLSAAPLCTHGRVCVLPALLSELSPAAPLLLTAGQSVLSVALELDSGCRGEEGRGGGCLRCFSFAGPTSQFLHCSPSPPLRQTNTLTCPRS